MEYYCTTCCREKSLLPGLLPALERYLDPRIQAVYARSQQEGRPLVILSGKFGLISAQQAIPYYDQALNSEVVADLRSVVVEQLCKLDCHVLRFFGLPRTTPGWEPYYLLIESSCAEAGVELQLSPLAGK